MDLTLSAMIPPGQDTAGAVPDQPNIWTVGSGEPIPHLDIEVAGAGGFSHLSAKDFDGNFEGCSHIFAEVTGPLQTVQRAEHWGVTLALQGFSAIHLGIGS